MKRPLLALGLALFTLACVPGLKPASVAGPAADAGLATNGLATESISVEPLGSGTQPTPAVAAPDALPSGDLAAPAPRPRPEGLTETAASEPPPGPGAEAEGVTDPKPPASPEEVACLRKGGLWIRAGKSIAMTCVKLTRDAGESCRREQDCQGQCLARSMTCAPYDPLFGCNEVLQNDGARVTLCIE